MSTVTTRRRSSRRAASPIQPPRPPELPAWAEKRARALIDIERIKTEVASLEKWTDGPRLEARFYEALSQLQEAEAEHQAELREQEAKIQARFAELQAAWERQQLGPRRDDWTPAGFKGEDRRQ